MGTHPIFESDFDCLTENKSMKLLPVLTIGFASAVENTFDINSVFEESWEATKAVYQWISNNYNQFDEAIETYIDGSDIDTAFDFCDGDSDGIATSDEITQCAVDMADFAEMAEKQREYMYRFGQKYWNVIDRDGDGGLNFIEFRDVWVGFAAVHVQMNLDNFDVNENGILDAEELTKWKEMGEAWMKQFGWEFTENQVAELGKLWMDAQLDEDPASVTKIEMARFLLAEWAYFIDGGLYDDE